VGAVPRRKADREAGKHFFSEEKKQKTFFAAFFQKRRPFLRLAKKKPALSLRPDYE
jgi:hypothetical protein